MASYVTLRVYDTVMEATEAEHQLARGGIAGVTRSGTQVQVDATYAGQARAVLAGSAPPTTTVAHGASAARDTAHQAASTVGDMAQHVASSAAETVQDAASAVTTQASKVTTVAADRVQDLADSIRQSGSSPDASGVQRQAAQTTASVLDKTAQYLGPGGLHTLVGDVRSSIQRNPLRSLVIGLGVGYLLRARYLPAQPTTTTSTPPAQPTPPMPSYPAASMQPDVDVPVSTSSDITSAPLLETTVTDTSLAMGDYDTTSTLIGDDVLDTDMALGSVDVDVNDGLETVGTTTDFADTGLDTSIGTSDLYAGTIDSDLSVGLADTDLRTDMAVAALGDDIGNVDVLGSDTLMDDSVSGDLGSTSSTSADTTFTSSSSTTPLSTDDLDTSMSLTDDASSTGTTDLSDVLSRWDERTRGEGSQS
jgi:hypothetical protein